MIEVEVSTYGLDFEEVISKVPGLRQKLVERLADIAYAKAFWGAPQGKTGKLAASIVKEIGQGEARVAATAPYAMYVVKGTQPHEIRPVNASVLRFVVPGGGFVFTRLVRHPGTRPNPFMQRAVDETLGRVEETFAELWLELI